MTDLIRRAVMATDDGDHHPPISEWAARQVLKVFRDGETLDATPPSGQGGEGLLSDYMIDRLDSILTPESPMHPIGCSTWEEAGREAVNTAKERLSSAQAELTTLREAARLDGEALAPFALAADNMNGDEPDTLFLYDSPESGMIEYGDLRRARARLSARSNGGRDDG